MKENNILRIREEQYNFFVSIAKEIDVSELDNGKGLNTPLFPGKHDFPTVVTLKASNILKDLRKHIPYLIYYKEVYNSPLDGVAEMKTYLNELFEEWVDIIPDKAYSMIDTKSGTMWRDSSIENRAKWFSEVIAYYGFDEFDEFLKDLVFLPFMKLYGINPRDYSYEVLTDDFKSDLKEVWKYVQKI